MLLKRIGTLRATARGLKRVHDEGGPERVRLVRVERPEGWILPSSAAVIDVETASGADVRVTPALPVPFVFAWAYRLARKLNVPLASDIEPEHISFTVPVPGWAWPGGRR